MAAARAVQCQWAPLLDDPGKRVQVRVRRTAHVRCPVFGAHRVLEEPHRAVAVAVGRPDVVGGALVDDRGPVDDRPGDALRAGVLKAGRTQGYLSVAVPVDVLLGRLAHERVLLLVEWVEGRRGRPARRAGERTGAGIRTPPRGREAGRQPGEARTAKTSHSRRTGTGHTVGAASGRSTPARAARTGDRTRLSGRGPQCGRLQAGDRDGRPADGGQKQVVLPLQGQPPAPGGCGPETDGGSQPRTGGQVSSGNIRRTWASAQG